MLRFSSLYTVVRKRHCGTSVAQTEMESVRHRLQQLEQNVESLLHRVQAIEQNGKNLDSDAGGIGWLPLAIIASIPLFWSAFVHSKSRY